MERELFRRVGDLEDKFDRLETKSEERDSRLEAKIGAVRDELRDRMDGQYKPLQKVVDMAIGAWSLVVLFVGVIWAIVSGKLSGKH